VKRALLVCLLIVLPLVSAAHPDERYENTFAKDFIMDAPWRVMDANTPIPLTIILKDCDVDDIRELHWIRCRDVTGSAVTIWEHDFNDEEIGDDASEENFWTWITTVTENHPGLPNGTLLTPANLGYGVGSNIELHVEIYYRDDWFNYSETRRLRVHVGGGPFPWPAGWYGGDVHYHSMYTNNIAEWGAPLPAVSASAEAMGLHWLTVTDHSCDLDETGDGTWSYATHWWEYTLQTPAGIQTFVRNAQNGGSSWGGLGSDVALLDSPAQRLYRGVEINLASVDPDSWAETLHCLFYNPDYIHSPLCGAIGERPVSPSLTSGLAQLAPTGFAYAAHPGNDLGGEWGGIDVTVNGTAWGDEDISTALQYSGFAGLQVFNTRQTLHSYDQFDPWADFDAGSAYTESDRYPDELLAGLALWDDAIAQGLGDDPPRKVFIAGGSDAHGDFNFASHLGLDDYATDNAMGKVQTVVPVIGAYGPGNLPPMSELLAAYRAGRGVATDGPFVAIGSDLTGDNDADDAEDLRHGDHMTVPGDISISLELRWASLPEFGPVNSVKLLLGDADGTTLHAEVTPDPTEEYGGVAYLELFDLSLDWRYLRAELLTADGGAGHRAYSNPIWLRWDTLSAVEGAPAPPRLLASHPNPFNPRTEIRFLLPEANAVTLSVHGADGRLLTRLLDGAPRPAGESALMWDGRDARGRELPSGVYLLHLRSAGHEEHGKVTLLR